MSLRTFQTCAIDCDECGATISETCTCTPDEIKAEAQRRGWLEIGEKNLCRQCQHEAARGDQSDEDEAHDIQRAMDSSF